MAGGSGTYIGIRQLAAALSARGLDVQRHGPARAWRFYTLQRLAFNLAVAGRLRRGGYDWVVGFDLDGFHYGRAPVAPYVASLKGVIADERQNERGVPRLMLGIQAAFERLAVRRAAVIVTTSRYSRDRARQLYGVGKTPMVIVPEPIDLAAWEGLPARPPADPPAVLTVAHLYPRKNLGVLLEAYRRLEDAGVAFQAWVVGEGPCRARWQALRDGLGLAPRVAFLGTVPLAELRERYARASVFCLPSKQEGFGIVFLEAMAAGLPVVAGRAAAVPETVADGQTGLLVEPRDPDALATALAGLLAQPARRRALGAAGRQRVRRYGADAVAGLFLTRVGTALGAPATEEAACG
ncbi:MAG: glycosyltransferase family 4 protein [Candidatus Methylomirabilales bacterium]